MKEYRAWFTENKDLFTRKPDIYQARLKTKFEIDQPFEQINIPNSSGRFKEDLTIEQVEQRLDSYIKNKDNA